MKVTYQRPPDGGRGWAVTFTAFLTYAIVWTVPRALGVVFTDLQDKFGSSNIETSWITSLIFGFLGCGTLPASLVTSYFGARKTMVSGGVVACIGCIILSQAPNLPICYMGSVITGIGFGFAYCNATSQIGIYFDHKRAIAYGLASLGAPFIGIFFPIFLSLIATSYDLNGTLLIVAGFCLNLAVGGSLLVPVEILASSPTKTTLPGTPLALRSKDKTKSSSLNEIASKVGSKELIVDLMRFPPVDTLQFFHEVSKSTNEVWTASDVIENWPTEEMTSSSLPHLNVVASPKGGDSLYRKALLNRFQMDNDVDSPFLHAAEQNMSPIQNKQHRISHNTFSPTHSYFKVFPKMAKPYLSLLFQWRFMLLVLSGYLDFTVRFCPTWFIVVYAKSIGISKTDGAYLLVVFSICDSSIRPIAGYLSTKIPRHHLRHGAELLLFGVAQLVMGLTCFGAPSADSFASLSVYMGVYGVANGLNSVWLFPVITRFVPTPRLHHAIGIFHFFGGIGILTGPPFAGFIADTFSTYVVVFYFSGAGFLLCTVVVWTLYYLAQKYGIRNVE